MSSHELIISLKTVTKICEIISTQACNIPADSRDPLAEVMDVVGPLPLSDCMNLHVIKTFLMLFKKFTFVVFCVA